MRAVFKMAAILAALFFGPTSTKAVFVTRDVTGIQRDYHAEEFSIGVTVFDHSNFVGNTPLFTNNFADNKTVRLTLAAPAGMKFLLNDPGPDRQIYMRLQTDVPNPTGPYNGATFDGFVFTDLQGVYGSTASFSQWNDNNNAPFFFFEAAIAVPAGGMSFTSIGVDFTFPPGESDSFTNQNIIIQAWAGRDFNVDSLADVPPATPDWVSIVPVPEPTALAPLALIGITFFRHRQQRRAESVTVRCP